MSWNFKLLGNASNNGAEVDANGTVKTGLYDASGNAVLKTKNGAYATSHGLMPIAGLNDATYRPARVDRFGGLASAAFTPLIAFQLFTAAVPPNWSANGSVQSSSVATASGVLLNSSAVGNANSNMWLSSFGSAQKYQKTPLQFRARARLIPGGTNGQADWGLQSTQTAGPTTTNAFIFLYGADGTLKPTIYTNGSIDVQGTDFIGSINSAKYYVWDVLLDDDFATFICQDPTTGAIVNEQTLQITALDPRFGMAPYWFPILRSYVGSSANVGAATQLYVADVSVGMLDIAANKPWAHQMAGLGNGVVINPTISAAQLANYAGSAAPASATLSNSAAGYTTLGGQFQFAAVAGAETDYSLFDFTVPTGLRLYVTDISIDTMNTGAAVATTPTWLQWFMDVDSGGVAFGSQTYRVPFGNQVFPIAAAIGAQATPINQTFATPYVTNSGRIFKVAMKMPLGTATASQIIRGLVRVGGYFE